MTSALHAASSTVLYRIGTNLWKGKIGLIGGLVGWAVFFLLPSSLLWYGQNLKDTFSILGILVVIDAWLALQSASTYSSKYTCLIIFEGVLGIIIIDFVRPYLPVLLISTLLLSFITLSIAAFYLKIKKSYLFIGSQSCFILVLIILSISFVSIGPASIIFGIKNIEYSYTFSPKKSHWSWHSSNYIPSIIDSSLKKFLK